MKIGILHLTDMHLTENYCNNSERETLLMKAMNKNDCFDVEKVYLVMSGDLTNTGNEKEFKQVSKLISSYKSKISDVANKKVEIIMVPGNHDLCFESEYVDDDNRFKNNDYYSIFNKKNEYERLNNFYTFSNKYKLFQADKVIDAIEDKQGDERISFCMINSALYSQKTSQSDKGYHYLTSEELDQIEQLSKGNINIMVTHHDFNWFDWETRVRLENICNKYYAILLTGHEHYTKVQKVSQDNNMDTLYIQGNESIKDSILNNCEYIVIDSGVKKVYTKEFRYDTSIKDFICESNDFSLTFKTKANRIIQLDADFENDLIYEDKESDIFDYFVFPRLEINDDGLDKKKQSINSYADLMEKTNDKKIINITGTDCIGKTTLLKYLYLKEINNGWLPLLINKDDSKVKKSELIKKCFRKQYVHTGNEFEKFKAVNNKILLIDDFESFKDSEKLLDEYKDEFEKIYIFNNKNVMNYRMKEDILNKLKCEETYLDLNLCRFSKRKRKELIKKVCAKHSYHINSIDKKVDYIELMLLKQQAIFKTDPLYIINFTKYLINASSGSKPDKNIFDNVFTAGITEKLKSIEDDKFTKIAPILLQKLAYYSFKNKKYPFELKDYCNVATEYSNNTETINAMDYLQKLMNSRIIRQVQDNYYRFENKYYLAYFVASELQYLYNNKGEVTELSYLLKNICKGINSDILLYFSMLNQSEELRNKIISMAEDNTKDINPFDLKTKKYIFLYLSDKEIEVPTEEDQEKYDSETENDEDHVSNVEVLDAIGYFDYEDVSEITNEVRYDRAIKYEEILGKILINFYPSLTKEKKNSIIKLLFNIPNQILTLFLDNFEDQINEFRRILYKISKDNPSLELDVNKFISNILIYYITGVYDLTANWYSIEDLKDNLVSYTPSNDNEWIQQIISYGKFDDLSKFLESAAGFINKNKDYVSRSIVCLDVRQTMLLRNEKPNPSNRKWLSSIFSTKGIIKLKQGEED
ncbi:MAG: metallophosphoesterase [Acholeplasmatales bacterium]|nr:metallophosphoesterase [Acholeplasmatales bacterium]